MYMSNLRAANLNYTEAENSKAYAAFMRSEKPQCKVVNSIYAAIKQDRSNVISAKRDKNEKETKRLLFISYYEKTPQREKSKFSDRERRLMTNKKIVVPANYPAPTGQEVRLAVIRSMADRSKTSYRTDKVVITSGHRIYFPSIDAFRPITGKNLGVSIQFGEPKKLSCKKRSGFTGYICKYHLGSDARLDRISAYVAETGIFAKYVRWSLSHFSDSWNPKRINWFTLTNKGWRQPHTKGQKVQIAKAEREADERFRRSVRKGNREWMRKQKEMQSQFNIPYN